MARAFKIPEFATVPPAIVEHASIMIAMLSMQAP
jgi:hypothetical protein